MSRARYSLEARRQWSALRATALECISEAACRIIPRPVWLVCLACMKDTTGAEIERHLQAMSDAFAIAVVDMALREHWAGYGRTWEDWRARRLATICIFLAYLCQRSEYHGRVVWAVRGIPKGALIVATRITTLIGGVEYKKEAHANTLFSDFVELARGGLLLTDQFPASKVPVWCRGKVKVDGNGNPRTDKNGRPLQFAFNYYFLAICPWPDGGDAGRIIPTPRGTGIRRLKASATPAVVVETKRNATALPAGLSSAELERLEGELQKPEPVAVSIPNAGIEAAEVLATMRSRVGKPTASRPRRSEPQPTREPRSLAELVAHAAALGRAPPDGET